MRLRYQGRVVHHSFTRLRQRIEAWLVRGLLSLLRCLPVDFASSAGGAVFRLVGPFLPPHRVARRNLERAFPEKSAAETGAILRNMWDNLGRTAGEYPHHQRIAREANERITFRGVEILDDLAASPRPVIFISAHLANWELMPVAAAQRGVYPGSVYRAPNNPFLAAIFQERAIHPQMELIAKGPAAGREILKRLRQRRTVAILIDQKLREGIPVPFFGRDAMTPNAFARFALRLDCDIIPVRLERHGGARFTMTVLPPLAKPGTGDHDEDVRRLTHNATALIEQWVRARPAEWFWVHRRWPD